MASFACPVRPIEVEAHPNLDKLEVASVDGYQVCVGKGDYETGDLAVYIPEAAIVPQDILKELGIEGRLGGKEHNRVRAMKFRGVLSSGLLYPLTGKRLQGIECHINYDMKDVLGITKYEPVIPSKMEGEVQAIPKQKDYDIENWRRFPHVIEEGDVVYFTEKIHGSFCRISYHSGEWYISSKKQGHRGLGLVDGPKNDHNIYVMMFRRYRKVFEKLVAENGWTDVMFCGEVFGSEVQDLSYGVRLELRMFDVFVYSDYERQEGEFLSVPDFMAVFKNTWLETVPILYMGGFKVKMMEYYGQAKSTLAPNMSEGIVIKPAQEQYSSEMERLCGQGRVILKYVGQQYLTRKKGTEYT